MITERQLKKVIEDAGYTLAAFETGRHHKVVVADSQGRTAKLTVSISPKSKSHWPHFVLADIKRKMR